MPVGMPSPLDVPDGHGPGGMDMSGDMRPGAWGWTWGWTPRKMESAWATEVATAWATEVATERYGNFLKVGKTYLGAPSSWCQHWIN